MRWLSRLWECIKSWFIRRPQPFKATWVSDLPEILDSKLVYLVGENEYLWYAAFCCPCGCGETIQLSCLPDARPRWKVSVEEDGSVSLHPSVWRVKGCKSHFFLRRGLVAWCSGAE